MKKKRSMCENSTFRKLFNLFRVMKIVILFMLIGLTHLSAEVRSQNASVSLKLKDVTVEQVILEVEKQLKQDFFFSKREVDVTKKISVNLNQATLDELVRVIFGEKFGYRLVDNLIVITPKAVVAEEEEKTILIKGQVVDKGGAPLPGVTVLIEGTMVGSATDVDGKFSLPLPKELKGVVVVFRFVGMETQKIQLANIKDKEILEGRKNLKVVMEEQVEKMDEVVVTGYQTVNRKDMVGSYSVLKASDIMMPAYSSIDQMLQGQVAGMIVMNTSSRVGTNPQIRIRGTTTLLGNKDPLWVVDGVVQSDPISMDVSTAMTDDLKNILGNQISWLNPSDIETITVLKDASATAIYGSKASNGVIVITTKRGKNDRMSINYNVNFAFRTRPRYEDFDLMNSYERIQFSKEVYDAGAKYKETPLAQACTYEGLMQMYMDRNITEEELKRKVNELERVNTDWFKLLTRNSFSHSHNLSVTGGTQKVSYTTSFGYNDEKGIELGNNSKRLSGRVRVGLELHPKVHVDISLIGQLGKNTGYGPEVNPLEYATNTSRAIPAFDENGKYLYQKKRASYKYWNGTLELNYNILNELENSYSQSKSQSINTTVNFSWDILPWLRYEFVGGVSSSENASESYAGEKSFYVSQKYRGYDYSSVDPQSDRAKAAILPFGGEFFTQNRNTLSYNIQNKLLVSKTFKEIHRLNIMLGTEIRSTDNKSVSNTVWGYVPERGEQIMRPTAPNDLKPTTGTTPGKDLGIFEALYQNGWGKTSKTDNYFSLFATVAYSLKDRYVFNFNVRNDVSNRFGQDVNKRVDPTYSFGLSYRMAEENFIKEYVPWLEQLNLRVTYGIQGNVVNSLSPDLIAKIRGVLPVYNQYYSTVYQLPNPHLKWEKTKTWNLGLDLQLLRSITMVLEYYGRTSNAIINQDIPQEYGMDQMALNGGHITNEGIEYTINITPFNSENFAWTIGLNSSKNWNKAKKADIKQPTRSDYLMGYSDMILKEGYPLSGFWSYSFKGLNPETGYPEFNLMDLSGVYGEMDPAEYLVFSGQSEPDFTGGLNTRIRYKGFSVGANFSLLLGAKKRLPSPFKDDIKIPNSYTNLSRELSNRWKKSGDEKYTNIPAVYTGGEYIINLPDTMKESMYTMWEYSDIRVVDASFLRCTQLSFSWNIDRKYLRHIGVNSLSINANVNNVFVICSDKFRGFDPELGNSVMPRTYSVGVSVGF